MPLARRPRCRAYSDVSGLLHSFEGFEDCGGLWRQMKDRERQRRPPTELDALMPPILDTAFKGEL